ncbi:MAG: MATE family efflux transporter, partial [Rhodospirillales bacterium]
MAKSDATKRWPKKRWPHGRVWAIAGPVILSNLSIPLMGAVDTGVVGHLDGAEKLAGVAVGALVVTTLYYLLNFLRMSTTG